MSSTRTDFVHLDVRSPFSFYEGASRIPDLMETAVKNGFDSLAITDRNRVCGLVQADQVARKVGLHPVLGLLLDDPERRELELLLWAKNLKGYGILCGLSSDRLLDSKFNLLKVAGKLDSNVIAASSDISLLRSLQETLPKGCIYGNVTLPDSPEQRKKLRLLYEFCRKRGIPLVVTGNVSYADPAQERTAHLLHTIGVKEILRRSMSHQAGLHPGRPLDDGGELVQKFQSLPDALVNTHLIAEQCEVDMHLGQLKFPKPHIEENKSPFKMLKERVEYGLLRRYGASPSREVRERLAYELGVIDHLGFTGYMLIVHDIAREAWKRGIRTLGRGSAANSIVCYCLGITDVCPIRYHLYFERFLNPERSSPPDIDLDFSWRDRDEILKFIYSSFGDDHVAMIATTVTFRIRGALHESALSHGIPEDEITRITKRIPSFSRSESIEQLVDEVPECADLPLKKEPWLTVARDADRLVGLPRHLSIHVGGIVISPDPITHWTGLEPAPKGYVTTQYDMYGIEDLGLLKIDILSQRGLGVLKDATSSVRENTGETPPVDDVERLFQDRPTWENIRSGKTMGCFYIESPGMTALQKKLDCDHYELLVAASSVIRPGVSESGMMQQFIERVRDPSKAVYLHPKMKTILGETYGVMIYQEDVIKVAHHIAGLPLGRADSLRRAMSGKSRSRNEMQRIEAEFIDGCLKNGLNRKTALEIWRQVASFAGYAFCKAHSASFAVLSVQVAYLRTHHPAEFIAAVLANEGGYYSQAAYVEEAKRMGLDVLLPDINRSRLEHSGFQKTVQLGLRSIGVLREDTPGRILDERNKNGHYSDLADFIRRVQPTRDEAEALVFCGALDCFGVNRPTLMRRLRAGLATLQDSPGPLARGVEDVFDSLPPVQDWSLEEKYFSERRILGFSPGPHPLSLLDLPLNGIVPAKQMEMHIGHRVNMIGWAYSHKRISTRKTGETMKFISMEDLTGTFEVTVFPGVYRRYATLLYGHGPFRIFGRVEDEQGVCTLVAERVEKLNISIKQVMAAN